MKKSLKNFKGAFTIIELLVVIAIIAILTGIVMANLTGPKAKARDAKRVSDLGQIQLALELFYDRCKKYPGIIDPGDDAGGACPDGITLGTFLPRIPTAPQGNVSSMNTYSYTVDAAGGYQRYYLSVRLESNSPALQDDVDDTDWLDSGDCTDPVYCLTD